MTMLTRTGTQQLGPAVDRRMWFMVLAICLFGVLVMKEVSLPTPIIVGLGGMGLLALLAIGFQSPEIPLYVLVAYLPFSRILVGDFGTEATAFNLTNILCVWIFIAHVAKQTSKRRPIFQRAPLSRIILLFAFLGAGSLLYVGLTQGSWHMWELVTSLKRWLTPVLFYFLTLWVVRDKRVLKTIVVLIMVAVTVVALMACWDYMNIGGSSLARSRVVGVTLQPNTLAAFFSYYMFLFFGFFLMSAAKPKAWLLLAPFLICFRGIMVTFSRGGYLACAAGIMAGCFFRKKILFIIAVAIGLLALANPVLLPKGIRFRMGMTVVGAQSSVYQEDITQNLEASAASRIVIWRGAVRMIRDHPWRGVGYGGFPHYIARYTDGGQLGGADAHNSYLLVAAEMGLPTLFVLLIMMAMVFRYTHWLYRHTEDPWIKGLALGFLAGLAAMMVANMFGSRMDSQVAVGYFWVLCGLIMRAVFMERQEQAERRMRDPAKVKRRSRLATT